MTSHLSLTHTGLKKLPAMEGLSIESIELNRNLLRSLSGLPRNIKKLEARENYLRETGVYLSLPFLQELDLESNEIQLFDGQDEFRVCYPSLQILNISKNMLVNCEFLQGTRLKELSIHRNYLKVLDHLPPTLEKVDASICEIRMVQSRLPMNLQYLCLSNNLLRYAGLPLQWGNSLQTLILDKNRIERFPRNLPDSLHTLSLSRNSLFELPTKLPTSLKVLNLRSNRIRSIPNYTSHGKFIMFLISDNCLTTLPNESIASVLETSQNWNTENYHLAQQKIRKYWKRYVLHLRLRHFARTVRVRNELLTISMMPERWEQIDTIHSGWFSNHMDRHLD